MAESAAAITHRRVWRMAGPVILSNATIPILGAVDTGVVGQLGAAAPIGAVGIGAVTLSALYWLFGFLRSGLGGLTAQAIGAENQAEVAALMTRLLLISGGIGALLIALQGAIFWGVFQVASASGDVERLARDYMAIRIWAAPATIAGYGISGWLLAGERSGNLFTFQVGTNGLNIALSILFVLGFGWGVPGVALASLIAEWGGFFLGLWLCRSAFHGGHWLDTSRVFDAVQWRRIALVNRDIMLRSLTQMACFTSFVYLGANFGDATLAANQILMQFIFICSYAMDGFTFAAQSLVGQGIGARSAERVRRAALLAGQWALGISAVFALVFWIFGPALIDVMATAETVRSAGREYLIWMALTPLLGWAGWLFDGIYAGATRSRDMRNMMVISALCYLGVLLATLPSLGNHGLWLALLVFFTMRGVTLGLRFPSLLRAAT